MTEEEITERSSNEVWEEGAFFGGGGVNIYLRRGPISLR